MDDDLTFGTSVWGKTEAVDVNPLPPKASFSILTAYDDLHQNNDPFDDFKELPESDADVADDDFGDFGDFDEAGIVNSNGFEDDIGFEAEVPVAGPSSHKEWHPLNLDPLPPRSELVKQVNEILEPIWGYGDASEILTDEEIREVEGISQVLVTPERYFILSCT
jgi:hypothetical protein